MVAMRRLSLLGAPTNLGNRPYEDNGAARLTTLGPARLRDRGIADRLQARDHGDVVAAPYRDFVHAPGTIRNEDLILDHLRRLAQTLAQYDSFTVVLGGDCSILPGTLAGLGSNRDLGLVYIDGHSDFALPETSQTGGAAGMDLAFATGRGDTELARLRGPAPLVRDENVVAVGVRDGNFGDAAIRTATEPERVLDYLRGRPFLVHLDVDVLDPLYMPFVDSPEPGGLDPAALTRLLAPLVQHRDAIGIEVTIYDPREDGDGEGAELLTSILEEAMR